MKENLSKKYEDIFNIYLDFCPFYKRNLVDLNDMYEWLKEINLKGKLSSKYDFFILMEWFNATGFIKPLAILRFPPEKFKNAPRLIIGSKYSDLYEYYKDGLISFPAHIYNLTDKKLSQVEPWKFRVYKPINDEKDLRRFLEFDLDQYLYHPIQFFQLLTYLKYPSYDGFRIKKDYKRFYWKRRFKFEDSIVKKIRQYIKEENLNEEQYIKQRVEEGIGFHQLEITSYHQHHWLTESALKLWIKLESLYQTTLLRPSNSHKINMRLQISDWNFYKKDIADKILENYNEWCDKVMQNFSNYFSLDDFKVIKEIIKWSFIQLRIDGLSNFIDLFLLIYDEKKRKLKRFLNFFVNMIQIVRTLKIVYNQFITSFPELEDEREEPKWYDPKYVFETEKEYEENKHLVLLDYGLIPSEKFIIFIEGEADLTLLDKWLKYILYLTGIKVNVKKLISGKKSSIYAEYLMQNFDASEFFLILDQDTKEYAKGKNEQLKERGIEENSFHIFYPDFITANFQINDIIKAYKSYIEWINVKKKSKGSPELELNDEFLKHVREKLKNKNEEDKYEDLLKEINNTKLKTSFSKTKYAEHLGNVMMETIRNNDEIIYPFQKILGGFIDKIRYKKYPNDVFKTKNRKTKS